MRGLRALLLVGYPLLVFAALHVVGPRWVALGIAAVLGARALLFARGPSREGAPRLLGPALLGAGLLLATFLLGDARALFLVPAIVNAVLLYAFGRTLFGGETLVESIARRQHPELSPERVRHCRSVTIVWCAFFVANGAISLWLALAGDPQLWALYTGGIAYLLMGLLFAGEFVVRAWRFPRNPAT
jgi:uncharacterized membrane protein